MNDKTQLLHFVWWFCYYVVHHMCHVVPHPPCSEDHSWLNEQEGICQMQAMWGLPKGQQEGLWVS